MFILIVHKIPEAGPPVRHIADWIFISFYPGRRSEYLCILTSGKLRSQN